MIATQTLPLMKPVAFMVALDSVTCVRFQHGSSDAGIAGVRAGCG